MFWGVIEMGADIYWTKVIIRSPEGYQSIGKKAQKIFEELSKNINLNEWEYFICERFLDTESDEDKRKDILNFFETFVEIIEGSTRTTDVETMGDYYTFMTGGVSWGDDPSDDYDTLSRVQNQLLPQRISKELGIVDEIDPLEVYLVQNKDLPEKLKKQLRDFEIAKKV